MTIELPKRLDGNKWKLLYYGDLGATTGFNNVSRNILDNLYKTGLFDITVLAVNNWGEPDPDQRRYTIFPAGNNNSPKKDPYGASRFQEILMKKNVEFDIVFILQDTFVVSSYLEELMEKSKRVLNNKFVSIFYFPIDGIPGQQWIKAASAVDCPVTYTKFGHELCSKVYPPIARKLNVIPHGVNPEDFYPLPKEFSRDFRREVFKTVPDIDNKFIFFRVDRNQPRKDYPRLLIAFKEFLRRHPGEAILYSHCMPRDPLGHNLYDTCNNIGLRDGVDVFFPNKLDVKNGYPTAVINKLYSMADCYITNSLGGGWELCNTESFATKTPIIGPRNTSFIELIGENEERGYLANSGNNFNNYVSLINDLGVIRPLTDLSSLVAKMEYVFNNREEAAEKAEAAYEWVINNLTWENGVMPRWFSLFSQAMKALNAQKYALMAPGSQGQTPTRAFIF